MLTVGLRRGFGDKMVFGLQSRCLTQFSRRRDHAAAGDGDIGFHALQDNGLQTWVREVGQANPRVVAGQFSPQSRH